MFSSDRKFDQEFPGAVRYLDEMTQTPNIIARKILQVQLHIQQHLDQPLSLDHLAEVAGYSPCHFHRLFQGVVGERASDYVRRLRLERAAQSLRYSKKNVLEIALDSGYGSHEAFTRAFTRFFGVSPTQYQSLEQPPAYSPESHMEPIPYQPHSIITAHRPSLRVACLRVVGPYDNEHLGPAFQRVMQLGGAQGLMNPTMQGVGIYYDDPNVTEPSRQRADVGFTVGPDAQPTGELLLQTISAGRCAVLTHKGHHNTLHDAYKWLYSQWLPQSGCEPGNAPPYEVYINDCNTLPPAEWLTEICIPLA